MHFPWYLDYNNLTTLPSVIGQLKNLEKLDLNNNNLTTLPPKFGQLKNLQSLYLSYNNLTTLPPKFGQLKNLQSLYLSYNNLTTLPSVIGQLKNLKVLLLRKNKLDTLPSKIGDLKNLEELDLSNNNLTTLPPEIVNLRNLKYLYLGKNNLTVLPPEIVNLRNLRLLYLGKNPNLDVTPLLNLQNVRFDSETTKKLKKLKKVEEAKDKYKGQVEEAKDKYKGREDEAATKLQKVFRGHKVRVGAKTFKELVSALQLSIVILGEDEQKIHEAIKSLHYLDQKNVTTWLLSLQKIVNDPKLSEKDSLVLEKQLAKVMLDMIVTLPEYPDFRELFLNQITGNVDPRACGDLSTMGLNEIYTRWLLETMDTKSQKEQMKILVSTAKIQTLRKTLANHLKKAAKDRVVENCDEAVELYLDYEIKLEKKLGLILAVNRTLYPDFTERAFKKFLNKYTFDSVAQEVNNKYLSTLINDIPQFSFNKIEKDKDYHEIKAVIKAPHIRQIDEWNDDLAEMEKSEGELMDIGKKGKQLTKYIEEKALKIWLEMISTGKMPKKIKKGIAATKIQKTYRGNRSRRLNKK